MARIPGNAARVGTLASEGWRAGIAKAAEGFTYNRSLEGYLIINAFTTSVRGWVVASVSRRRRFSRRNAAYSGRPPGLWPC